MDERSQELFLEAYASFLEQLPQLLSTDISKILTINHDISKCLEKLHQQVDKKGVINAEKLRDTQQLIQERHEFVKHLQREAEDVCCRLQQDIARKKSRQNISSLGDALFETSGNDESSLPNTTSSSSQSSPFSGGNGNGAAALFSAVKQANGVPSAHRRLANANSATPSPVSSSNKALLSSRGKLLRKRVSASTTTTAIRRPFPTPAGVASRKKEPTIPQSTKASGTSSRDPGADYAPGGKATNLATLKKPTVTSTQAAKKRKASELKALPHKKRVFDSVHTKEERSSDASTLSSEVKRKKQQPKSGGGSIRTTVSHDSDDASTATTTTTATAPASNSKSRGGGGNKKSGNTAAASADNTKSSTTRVFCICRKDSTEAMIGCDNPRCDIEWYHYSCVGITQAPKGKWFCPKCRK